MTVAPKPHGAGWYLCTMSKDGEPILAHNWVFTCKDQCGGTVERFNAQWGERHVCRYWNGKAWADDVP